MINTVINAHNYCMKIYEKFNIAEKSLIFPFIFGSIFIALSNILRLIGAEVSDEFSSILSNFSDLFYSLLPYVFCYCISVFISNGKKWFVGFWSVLCLAVFSTAFKTVSSSQINVTGGIFVALGVYFVFKYLDSKILKLLISLISFLLIGLALGYLYDYFDNFNMFLGDFVSGKGLLSAGFFGAIKTIYSFLSINDFADIFFYKSYGGSLIIGKEIITGVKDLLSAGYDGKLLSAYLSGHYYLLFAVCGICVSMFSDLKGIYRKLLIFLLAATAVSGNLSLILLFLFFQCPWIFISCVIISALAYISAYIIDLGAGYLYDGGIIEMFLYHGNAVYLLAGGIVFLAIGYFVYKYCYEKYGISYCCNVYYPQRLKPIVNALGGINNIVRFRDETVEVRNPKIVNTILLNCEIDENIIKSESDELKELREYFDENKE